MEFSSLNEIAKFIVSDGKGILAADESNPTCAKRFDTISVESTENNRRDYRELLFRAPGMENNIGGVILFDETIRQKTDDGLLLMEVIKQQGALPGIKVDKGLVPFNNSNIEKVTNGIDDLDQRCQEYAKLGAFFTKWRAVLSIDKQLPSQDCIDANMALLAQYASIVQKNKMVPMVEPEVLMDGDHSIEDCYDATSKCLKSLFYFLLEAGVDVSGTILKPNMVTSGSSAKTQASIDEVAEATVECLKSNVPDELPAITFLSGGQSETNATSHLNAMNKIGNYPWRLSFSYGRALQAGTLKAWKGKVENTEDAQLAFSHRALMNKKASLGLWSIDLEI
tara:strand:- start:978 stop:1991 length:1014 start_codon:yes stop_codon:yes gene_type:complete